MFKIHSNNYPESKTASTLYEAQVIKGRDYNLFLADILCECPHANPIRGNSDVRAFVIWKGKTYSWEIEEIDEMAA